jgi:hypothetical protein
MLDTYWQDRWRTGYAEAPEGDDAPLGSLRGLPCRATNGARWSPPRLGASSGCSSRGRSSIATS